MKTLQEILSTTIIPDKGLILKLISFIDLTTLDNCDTQETVLALVSKANEGFEGVHPAALCTFANYGDLVRDNLIPKIKCAVVGGCFPTGQTLSAVKIEETRLISATSIDEIDIVLNRGDFFSQNYTRIKNEISVIKSTIGDKCLKVILETGDLETVENIKHASELAIQSGADFIKTSTGKTNIGATHEAVYTMCKVIKTHYANTGIAIGIKPSGGIRTLNDAIYLYKIVHYILGKKWLQKDLFRIGASSLYNNLITAFNDQK
mgnify:CR=1 FL=1